MDRARVRELESRCTEEQPPACAAACPVQVDARALAVKAGAGDFAGAFAVLARAVPFPRIVAHVCDHPCEAACVRASLDAPVRLHAVERACAAAAGPPPAARPQRRQAKTVAVLGAGLSGLTAAAELARKGWQVSVFEEAEQPGGRLRALSEEALPAAAVEADLALLGQLGVEVHCGHAIGHAGHPEEVSSLIEHVDAVYVATGPGAWLSQQPAYGGEAAIDPLTLATATPRVFAGGGLRRAGAAWSPIASVADGRRAAVSIDRLLQGASLTAGREPPGPQPCRLHVETAGLPQRPPAAAQDPAGRLSVDKARVEAGRCVPCHCLICVRACAYLEEFGAYPKRYVREIDNNDCIVMGHRKANKLVNSCALCGLCGELCPDGLAMDEVCREARASLVAKGKMPPSAHEFALRDLAFSNGERFALSRHAPGTDRSASVFFPGCQLAASSPELVERTYAFLRERLPGGVALHLGCCGAPADWAAREDLLAEALAGAAGAWEELGRPRVIAACPSCQRLFERRLPRAEVVSLWTVLAGLGLPEGAARVPGLRLALHDPCAARHDRAAQDASRSLLAALGAEVVELPLSRERTTCCSFGGLMSFANPELGAKVAARRAAQSDAGFASYCAMCRDNFAAQGKPSLHLLDLLFGEGAAAAARPSPSFSARQEARARLKARLSAELWGEPPVQERPRLQLRLEAGVPALLQRRMILEDELRAVIARAEETRERIEDPATGHRYGQLRSGNVTCWVEYSAAPGGFAVHDAWSHRMDVR